MLDLPFNVVQELKKLLPASILQHTICFVFYDNYPCDKHDIEVTICTDGGEIIEFHQRKPVFQLLIENISQPKDISIYRNCKGILHYLLTTDNELIICARNTTIEILKRIYNFDKFVIDDPLKNGSVKLRIWYKEDAMSVILDDNFEIKSDTVSPELFEICEEETLPILNRQRTKLIEAKYIVSQNEKNLQDVLELKKMASYVMYSKMYPEIGNAIFKKPLQEVSKKGM